MRVLIQPRPLSAAQAGGDYAQLMATLEPLRALGVEVDVSTDTQADVRDYDLVHLFSTIEPASALNYYFNARRQNKSVVAMPIYWNLTRLWEESVVHLNDIRDPRTAAVERLRREIWSVEESILVRGADVVLPISIAEGEQLVAEYGTPRERIRVVYNGVNPLFAQGDAARFAEQYGVRVNDFILSVGFVDARKNQAQLIRALRDDPRTIVLIGQAVESDYYALCQHEARKRTRGQVLFLGKQTAQVLADAYAAARVHALVSWQDVAPLVALEAAAAGCPQALTTECGIGDYLGDGAQYCDPADRAAILCAVDAAWNAPRAEELAARVLSQFTWERTARDLAAVYSSNLVASNASNEAYVLVHVADLMERRLCLLEELLEEQARVARELEGWAHDMERRLKTRATRFAALKNLLRWSG